ncbi:hypothetical protein RM844_31345 [Streptomyces sp. DSM 44915]|uniref:DUF3558 domain-containing protein n=1 Tax=Streptomyces chisholmiae TaxID=3075540 RepID=A0ABU2K195_9ACTN|nr:hypothetical protein [Streptomyces sp. DSM 44915]MDT0270774.1 hypothetical protein [Streptomyces sp. DSM 44915]
MGWSRRLAVTAGAVALLTTAACSSGDSEASDDEGGGGLFAGVHDEGTEESGTESGEGAEAESGGETDGESSAGSGEPAAEDAFDECGLFPTAELATIFGVDTLHITQRLVYPDEEGGRLAGCGYFTEDVPGVSGLRIDTVAGTDEAAFFAAYEGMDTGPLEQLGDRAEVLAMTSPGGEVRTREVRVIAGSTGLRVTHTWDEVPGGLPEMPDAELGQAVALVAATALERMPADPVAPDGTPEGPCAGIDLGLAAEVLGEELGMARSVVSGTGGLRCQLTGAEASLGVTVFTAPHMVEPRRVPAGEITVADLGDGARVATDQGHLDALVNDGERMVAISALHAPAVGVLDEPRPADIELLRSVLASVGG